MTNDHWGHDKEEFQAEGSGNAKVWSKKRLTVSKIETN